MTETKDQRVHLRVAASDDELFRSAAAAANESLSEFLVESGRERAERLPAFLTDAGLPTSDGIVGATRHALRVVEREITVTPGQTFLGNLSLPESNLELAHKNKYGHDYDPPDPDSPAYARP